MTTPSPDYLLRLLGGASIEGPEGLVTGRPAQRNALTLMAVLVTSPDRALPRETIATRLWPERDRKSARHLLNVTAYEIRKGLGEEALITVNGGLSLSSHVVGSDVEAFDEAVETGEWDRAVELYPGPFLDGFHCNGGEAFERWMERERWRCERLYRTALERLAEGAGDAAEAVDRWRVLLDRDPAHATATIGLMRALEAVGQRAEAIDVAHAHRTLLLDEYGADPNPDIEALADRLREAPTANGALEDLAEWDESVATPDPVDPSNAFDWRRSILPGAAAAALVAALVVAVFRPEASGPERATSSIDGSAPVTLVVPFENRSGDPELDELGAMAADWINQSLIGTGLLRVVSATHLRQTPRTVEEEGPSGPDKTARLHALAEIAGADIVVSGALHREGDSLVFQEQILSAETGEVLGGIDRLTGPVDDPISALERLRRHTAGRLAAVVDPRLARWSRSASSPPSYEAYSLFTEGLDAYARGDFLDAAHTFRSAAGVEDGFVTPSVWEALSYSRAMWNNKTHLDFDLGARADSVIQVLVARRSELAPWDRAMVDYLAARSSGDLAAGYDALRRVTGLTPELRWRIQLATYAYWLNRPGEAARILEAIDVDEAIERNLQSHLFVAVNSYHRLGEFERELEVARQWRERFPRAGMPWMYELRALGSLGRTDEVEAALDPYLENHAPGIFLLRELEIHGHSTLARSGYDRALEVTGDVPVDRRDLRWRWGRANLHYLTGNLREARAEFDHLLEDTEFSDNHVSFIGALGRIAAREGDRETALRMDRRLAETDWSEVWYTDLPRLIGHQRAQIAALLGDPDRATRILEESFGEATYREAHIRTMSPDLDLLKDDPSYRRLARPAG